jgi:hypothetical protein
MCIRTGGGNIIENLTKKTNRSKSSKKSKGDTFKGEYHRETRNGEKL